MARILFNGVKMAHHLLRDILTQGSVAVDATAGNGNDTLFLAKCVGGAGKVYAFDIQDEALANTKALLDEHKILTNIELVLAGHEKMNDYIKEKVDAITFNLGYLPKGNKKIITRPDTTIKAVQEGLSLLKSGGMMTLVIYTGHEGGKEEAQRVEEFLSNLSPIEYDLCRFSFPNRSIDSPYLLAVQPL